MRIENFKAAHCKLKMCLLAFFAPSLARKPQLVILKRVNPGMAQQNTRIAGVDGCRGGWIVVETTLNLNAPKWRIAPNWNAIGADADVMAVDMPIGISSNGVRQCEVEARRALSPCGSRVFKTLPRGALRFRQSDWSEANQWSKAQGYGGISKQTWNIRPRILEIDQAICAADQDRVFEAHPELAFARLNGGEALASKHLPEGRALRCRLLQESGFGDIGTWLKELRGTGAKPDDLMDACALVLTARHIARGTAKELPGAAGRDARGLRMSICF
jgi:predicted RNase H-like nuclease